KLISNVEAKSNTTIQKDIDVILAWLESCLRRQNSRDFKPKDDEIDLAGLETKPCIDCCTFLKSMYKDTVVKCFDGKNIEMFCLELGTSFHTYVYIMCILLLFWFIFYLICISIYMSL